MAADEVKIITVLGKKVIAVKDLGVNCSCGPNLECAFENSNCAVVGGRVCTPYREQLDHSAMFIEPHQYPEYLTQLLLR